ncbi:MAG: hypothetical protein A3K06_00780 [Candidatus Doudnabacteria bacterium RIFCSPHIGHO2_01_52_17]|uniref:Transcriptional regulator n=1 Tax=Candidatus Doudnabacteria bacterium RIFCSPHIGHO2_01_52_17 TaxID=1817820 RepID=A0A1F5NBZ8_9BACT|nr:MAG: hypothetical protein A3K06_00780 [Candidatus Doudnabacteria bacterium RIFCSPHIGHO2_01_52_17]
MKAIVKEKALRRLKIIQGQLKGLQQMIEQEKYCIDVIAQSSAIKEALASVEHLMLENHLATHVIDQVKSGKKGRAIEEILKVYKLAQRRK